MNNVEINLNGIDMKKVHKLVIENVEKGDVDALKSNIGVVINFDKNFSKGYVHENLEYIKRHKINLYDGSLDQTKPLLSNKSEYTDEDFSKAIFYLRKNFCKERLMDVQKIGQDLYKEKVSEIESNQKQQGQNYAQQNFSNDNKKKEKKIAIAIGVGIVAAGLIALALLKK